MLRLVVSQESLRLKLIWTIYTAGTLTNLGRPRCTLQSALSLGTLTLRRLARAHCDRHGEASTHSSDAFEQPSKRTEGSQKQTHLGLELLGCISVRFVIYSQKQEGSVMRKRSGSAHRNSWHHRYRSSYHHQVMQLIINKPIHSLSIYQKKTYSPNTSPSSYYIACLL